MSALDRLTVALADRYTLERELGAGGMATVYLAQDIKHDRKVAIKVLRPELAAVIGAERFLAEIKTTANLQHPHILPLFDSGVATVPATDHDRSSTSQHPASSFLFYVMPYVEGISLRDRMTREKQLPIGEAVRIATEIAAALDYAHRHGVIHRDIKPENILLHDGSALVADFGIALAASKAGTRMTETGMSLGTPQYMSPEQAMGERELDARSDVYALGCVTYEMLTGEPPFSGPTAQAIVAKVMTAEPADATSLRKTIPLHVADAVHTALQKLPADRFATAAEFATALALGTSGTLAARRTTGHRATAGAPRWQALLPWGLAVVAIGAAAWGWLSAPPAPGTNWLSVNFSDSLELSLTGPPLALSPDGKTLVFRAGVQNGTLWVKQQSQLNPTPIPGTERSFSPAFSPDGQWLAFTADQQIKKIRLDGGAAVTLTDSIGPQAYGISWLDNGSLIYTSAEGDQLRQVSASGGSKKVVLADSAFRGFGLLSPTPLPKASGILFQLCTSGCVTSSIHVLDLGTGVHKLLIADALQAWYLPIGYLLYVRRDGAVLAAPFDLKKLEITGPAVTVLDGVMVSVGNPILAWSPAGTLVYLRSGGTSGINELVRVARAGVATTVDSSWSGAFNSVALSPDGQQLAVGLGRSAGGLNIWIKQLDRGPFSRLSFGGQDRRPAWSADGKMVAFIRDSSNGGNIYGRPADGSGTDVLIGRINRPTQEVTWSGDGQWLVARTDNGTAGAGDLIGLRTTGDSTPVPLVATSFTEMHPAVSHDGRWLAYSSNESGVNEVYVRPFPITSGGRWQVSNGGGTEPVWSPDGRELYFINSALRLVAAEIRTAPAFGVVRLQALFDVGGFVLDPFHQMYSVTRDGRGFLFVRTKLSGRGLATRQTAVLVENWFADLRARLKR